MIYRRRKIQYLLSISRLIRTIRKRHQKSTKNNLTQLKEASMPSKINDKSQPIQFSAVYQLKYPKSICQDNKVLFNKLGQLIPLKLFDCPMPTYIYPNKVKVVISKPDLSEKAHSILIPYEQNDHSNTLYEQISLQQFLQYKGALQLSIAQMSLQKDLVSLPKFITDFFTEKSRGITKNMIKMINLWHYKGNRISSWHYDGHDNFLFMIEGKKIIYLMQPNNITGKNYIMSPQYHKTKGVFDLNHNHSKTDNFGSFALYKNCFRCQVIKGECLFIPRGWWHYVQSIGQSNVAINIWGNSVQNIIQKTDEEMMLKHLIFQVSDRLMKKQNNQQDGKQNSQMLKKQYRKSCFRKYFDRIID